MPYFESENMSDVPLGTWGSYGRRFRTYADAPFLGQRFRTYADAPFDAWGSYGPRFRTYADAPFDTWGSYGQRSRTWAEYVDVAVTAVVACVRHTAVVVAKLCSGTTSRDKVFALYRCAVVHPFGYLVGCHIFVNLISQVKPPKILWTSVTRAITLCKIFLSPSLSLCLRRWSLARFVWRGVFGRRTNMRSSRDWLSIYFKDVLPWS